MDLSLDLWICHWICGFVDLSLDLWILHWICGFYTLDFVDFHDRFPDLTSKDIDSALFSSFSQSAIYYPRPTQSGGIVHAQLTAARAKYQAACLPDYPSPPPPRVVGTKLYMQD